MKKVNFLLLLSILFFGCGTQKQLSQKLSTSVIDTNCDTINININHYFPNGKPVDVPIDTIIIVPPIQNSPKVYLTADPGVSDFMASINVQKHPRALRHFYLQNKDHQDNTTPSEIEFIQVPPEYDKQYPWYVYSNYFRMKGSAEAIEKQGGRDLMMISTENIFGPNGIVYGFPNKNWPFAAWGSKAKIKEFAHVFISNMNLAHGVGTWIWQFSSEPWHVDWLQVQEAYYEAWLEVDPELRPKLASAALPMGQGETTEQGTNKWFEGELTDFIPEYMRKDISVVCVNAYALVNLEWVNDPSIATDVIQRAWDFQQEYLPHAELQVTEFGYPGSDEEIQYQHMKAIIDWCSQKPNITKLYAFNYIRINSNDVFNDCFLAYKDDRQPRKAYQLITTN